MCTHSLKPLQDVLNLKLAQNLSALIPGLGFRRSFRPFSGLAQVVFVVGWTLFTILTGNSLKSSKVKRKRHRHENPNTMWSRGTLACLSKPKKTELCPVAGVNTCGFQLPSVMFQLQFISFYCPDYLFLNNSASIVCCLICTLCMDITAFFMLYCTHYHDPTWNLCKLV